MRYMPLPLSFRWPDEFVAAIDKARGDVPRTAFVKRAVEAALALRDAPPASSGLPPRGAGNGDMKPGGKPAPPQASGPSEERVREAKAKVAGACKTHGRPANRVGGRCNLAGCMG